MLRHISRQRELKEINKWTLKSAPLVNVNWTYMKHKAWRVNLVAPASPVHRVRYRTNWDRKGWPDSNVLRLPVLMYKFEIFLNTQKPYLGRGTNKDHLNKKKLIWKSCKTQVVNETCKKTISGKYLFLGLFNDVTNTIWTFMRYYS